MSDWKVGDRVQMRSPERYVSSLRRLGDRKGTVSNVWVPAGCTRTCVRVVFDVYRKGATAMDEVFSPTDLVAAVGLEPTTSSV